MRKRVDFEGLVGSGWPSLKELKHRFWTRLREDGTVIGQLSAEGVNGTAHLEARNGRIDVGLRLQGDEEHGVILLYWKRGYDDVYSFTGDLSRLREDRKSTRLNSSHLGISYAVFCLKKKKNK